MANNQILIVVGKHYEMVPTDTGAVEVREKPVTPLKPSG